MTKPMRIAVLHFAHEKVTFLKNDTTVEDFLYQGSPAKGEEMLAWDPTLYMGGFVKVAREFDGVELIGLESPRWPKTGTGTGWIVEAAFQRFVGTMIAELKAAAPVDGVYLSIHGAMGVRGVPRPEAELARRVREAVGRDAVIAATFDPHGNEDEAFLRYANLAFTAKYFPHYDSYLQGERPARTWCAPSAATTLQLTRRSKFRYSRPPCCNGRASRPGWTWCNGRSPGRRANPTFM